MHAILSRAAATTLAVAASLLPLPSAGAQAPSLAPAASADAYALDVDVKLGPTNVPVDQGPRARSSQDYPPQQAEMDQAAEFNAGQVPSGSGALVQSIRILGSRAGANSEPVAVAEAVAEDVLLLNQPGTGPLITATTLRAISTSDCLTAPSAAGTEIVDLKVAGLDPVTNPAPNTEVGAAVLNPLGLRAIANEQHPTADGRGFVVNALHVYQFAPATVPNLFRGDIIVSHAMSTVNCPNGAPSTGDSNPIFIVKNADKAQARVGDTITYTATIQNKSSEPCPVNQVVDHLPAAFEYTSTSGAFGTAATAVNRPGGGQDVVIKPTNVTIAAGGSATQTYVVTVKAEAQPGTYFNNVEILCGNLGNWVKGLDAPVQVVTTDDDETEPEPEDPAQCEDGEDNDGDGKIDFPDDPGCHSKRDDNERNEHPRTGGEANAALLAAVLLGAAYGIRRRLA